MNILARLLLSKLPSSDAPAPPAVAASAGPAAPASPGAAGHGDCCTTSELLHTAAWYLAKMGAPRGLIAQITDRAAQFEAEGD
jgi:hypothetical protein